MSVERRVRTVEDVLADILDRVGVGRFIAPDRAVRAVEFAAIGATGVGVDLVTVATTTAAGFGYLAASVIAFLVACTWNFQWNRVVTFDRPDGLWHRQYAGYIGVHVGGLGVRLLVVTALVELASIPVLFASLIGIKTAAAANFFGSEQVFNNA